MVCPNLDVNVLAHEEVGLLKPLAFKQNEWNLGTRLMTYPASVGAVVVSGSDLELAILHDVTCCNFYVAKVGGRVGRNSNRYCLGYSLRAGLVFTKTPDQCVPNLGHKKNRNVRVTACPPEGVSTLRQRLYAWQLQRQ